MSAHLDKLLAREKITSRSAKKLDELLRSNIKALDAIKALKVSTTDWDPLLVHFTASRLDNKLRESWENRLGSTTSFPKYAELQSFLTGRARAMETIDLNASTQATAKLTPVRSSSAFKTTYSRSFAPRSSAAGSPTSVYQSSAASTSDTFGLCPICSERHYILFCPAYKAKTTEERLEALREHRLCFNCLGRHRLIDCRTRQSCQKCGERHHTSTHLDRAQSETPVRGPTNSDEFSAAIIPATEPTPNQWLDHYSNVTSAFASNTYTKPAVLLATYTVLVTAHQGHSLPARALIDQGAELSFVSEQFARKVGVNKLRTTISLHGIGNSSAGITHGVWSLEIKSLYSNHGIQIHAHLFPVLTAHIPSFSVENPHWPHLEGLQLADPEFLTPGPVDMVLGAAPTGLIINPDVIRGTSDTPVAQSTLFGWIIFGSANSSTTSDSLVHTVSTEQDLHELLSKFWSQEEPPATTAQQLSADEEECELHFVNTHSRDPSGRYIVRLPLKAPVDRLGAFNGKFNI